MTEASEVLKKIGEKIRKRRDELNMSQQELADNADVAKSTIQRLEKGEFNPSIKLIVRIAEELKFGLLEFFS